MNALGVRAAGRVEDAGDVEIALARGMRTASSASATCGQPASASE
jgi:hypothetical protein